LVDTKAVVSIVASAVQYDAATAAAILAVVQVVIANRCTHAAQGIRGPLAMRQQR
jgi:hypothetical protein